MEEKYLLILLPSNGSNTKSYGFLEDKKELESFLSLNCRNFILVGLSNEDYKTLRNNNIEGIKDFVNKKIKNF